MIKTIPQKRILLVQIKLKRQDMYMSAKHFGLSHPIVVACSQELDTLLNRYQGIKESEPLNNLTMRHLPNTIDLA